MIWRVTCCPLADDKQAGVAVNYSRALLAKQPCHNQIRRGARAGHREVVDRGEPGQGLDVYIMRHWRQWVDKEDQCVKLSFADHGTDLLIASQRAAFQAGHMHVRIGALDPASGGPGRHDTHTRQKGLLLAHPRDYLVFLGIMSNKCEAQGLSG